MKLLRLHGSYDPDQFDKREVCYCRLVKMNMVNYAISSCSPVFLILSLEQTENGLVEAVVLLVSEMPRMRHDLPNGKLGTCYQTKHDYIKVCYHASQF